jgi:phage shock protein A
MADNLRLRVTRIITGGAHALLDKIEDAAPLALLEQSVREVEQVTDEVRAELGRLVANRHVAQQQHVHLNQEHEALSAAIATALAQQREDLAKPAIARQLDIEAQLPILESSLAELGRQDQELSSFIEALMGKKREMDKSIADFEASRRLSQSPAAAGQAASGGAAARLQTAQSAFDRTYQRQTGLSPAGQSAGLAQAAQLKELNQLVQDNKINERLAALKAGSKDPGAQKA